MYVPSLSSTALLGLLSSSALAAASPLQVTKRDDTFRPGITFPDPAPDVRRIHPFGRTDLCMMVQGGELVDGANVGVAYCHPTDGAFAAFQFWNRPSDGSSGRVRLNGTSFCLDLSEPQQARLRDCGAEQNGSQSFVQQQAQIKRADTDQCLQVKTDSPQTSDPPYSILRQIESYTCSADSSDVNQHFTVYDGTVIIMPS